MTRAEGGAQPDDREVTAAAATGLSAQLPTGDQSAQTPPWTTWREACAVVAYRPHLRRTITVALVVGTLLFAINQLDVVVRGDADAVVWVKTAFNYVVPCCVANMGLLVGTRRRERTG